MDPEKLRRITGISGFAAFVSSMMLLYFVFFAAGNEVPSGKNNTYIVALLFVGLLVQAVLYVYSKQASVEFTGRKFMYKVNILRVIYPAILLAVFTLVLGILIRFNMLILVFAFSMAIHTALAFMRILRPFECIFFNGAYVVSISTTIRVLNISEIRSIEISQEYVDFVPQRGVRLRVLNSSFASGENFAFRDELRKWTSDQRFSAVSSSEGSPQV